MLYGMQVTTEERLKAAAFVCDSTSATVPASIASGSKVPDSAMQQATASLGSNGRSALELEVDQVVFVCAHHANLCPSWQLPCSGAKCNQQC